MRNSLLQKLRSFRAHDGGSIASLFAFSAPVVLIGIAATVDYSNTVTLQQRTQAAADSAAVAATTSMVNAINASGTSLNTASAITTAQSVATQFFTANAPPQAVSAQTAFTATTTYVNGKVSTTVGYAGAPVSLISGFVGSGTNKMSVNAVAVSPVTTTVTVAQGTINGTGWIAEDPVVQGADGSYGFMEVCDVSHKTWYNLLSDSQFEVNANCDGTGNGYAQDGGAYGQSELYQFEVLAGSHTVFVTPTLQQTSWNYYGYINREVWTGDVTIDGSIYPAVAGTNTYLNDTANNIQVTVTVGQPGVSGSASNYVTITTPTYSVSIAYDSDDDGAWNFGLANIQVAATNAGACGALGGVWGRTTASVHDHNWQDFVVPTATSTASQFGVTCNITTVNATKARMTQ